MKTFGINSRIWKVIFPVLVLTISLFSCKKENIDNHQISSNDNAYFSIINSLDTLTLPKKNIIIDSIIKNLASKKSENSIEYNYFSGYKYYLKNQNDSAKVYFQKIETPKKSEWITLKKYWLLYLNTGDTKVSPEENTVAIIKALNEAEKNKSQFCYRYYDLLAKASFLNHDEKKAKEFSDKWYQQNPYNKSSTVKNRYFHQMFLLSERIKDKNSMKIAIDSLQYWAKVTKDTTTLMIAKGLEAQWNRVSGDHNSAIRNGLEYFNYLKENNRLKVSDFNNIGVLFANIKQPDLAIQYYKQGLEFAKKNDANANALSFYIGLKECYSAIGDYKNAFVALDSVQQINQRNNEKIQAEKIEEIHTKYETEKKDIAIANLKQNNDLIKKNSTQQRWLFGGFVLILLLAAGFILNNYRRKALQSQNEKLELENKKLNLEQKLGQMQLNPHFIHNSIANLQGLISANKNNEANNYLIALSQYIRNTLELNREDFITLKEEIDNIKNYLHLQQMRYHNSFYFVIDANDLDLYNTQIPPMLLQPFIENSIEHGFKNIQYKGMLKINLENKNNKLNIKIIDNGSGKGQEHLGNKKSLSTNIIVERLDLLFNQEKPNSASLHTEPIENEGKTGYLANLQIPIIND